jgi:hypothetical protein
LEKLGQWKASAGPTAVPQSAEVARTTWTGARSSARVGAVAFAAAAFWMFLIWAIHRESPRTLVSFHGFIHAAIAQKFIDPASATFPPENPFFAGQPLPYYWAFQFLAAQITRLLGWNVFYSLEAVILGGTAILIFCGVGLGRVVFRSTLTGILIGYLVMAGTNPFGFIFAALKLFMDGPQRLHDDPQYLWGIVHPVYGLIRYNDMGGLYGPLLNFFLNMTSRPVALAFLMAQMFVLRWALQSPKPLSYVLLLLGGASAITTALSPITGIATGGALTLALALYLLWRRRNQIVRKSPCNLTLMAAGVVSVMGVLFVAPTYYHLVLSPSDSQPQFWLFSAAGLRHSVTVVLSIAPLLILALIGLNRTPKGEKQFVQVLFVTAAVLLTANCAFVLPSWNQSNFFHAAVVMLAIPAAGSILRRNRCTQKDEPNRHNFIGFAALVLMFLPTAALLLSSYVGRPSLPVIFEDQTLKRMPQESDLAGLYRWVQGHTQKNAIFVTDPRRRVAMVGNIAEFPAMTGRAIFTEETKHYLIAAYPDAKTRFEIAVRLVSGSELSEAEEAYLSKFHRPIYVIRHESKGRATVTEGIPAHYGYPVFRAGDVVVVKWSARALGKTRGNMVESH